MHYTHENTIQNDLFGEGDDTLGVAEFLGLLNQNLKRYRVIIEGEITGRVNRRGAVTYFSLHDHDDDAVLQCMGFNSILDKLGIELETGMAVKISGNPEIWKRTGGFSFKVFSVQLTGEGDLLKQFEALKKKLEKEGLFDEKYKVSLPDFVTNIGLITSEGREAQTDFLTHLSSHGIEVTLLDSRVEGAQAVGQIVNAISWFNINSPETQVIVLTRGGGSLENLSAFNADEVARAIFASRIPVMSAVGHEKDVSIADMVADVRASTPTHAGKIISASWDGANQEIILIAQKLGTFLSGALSHYKTRLGQWIEDTRNIFVGRLADLNSLIQSYSHRLALADPQLKLSQGYSIVKNKDGKIVRSDKDVMKGDRLNIKLHKGEIASEVI